jgi:hypothetical protein
MSTYESLNFFESNELLTFEPAFNSTEFNRESLVINRITGQIELNGIYLLSSASVFYFEW